MTSSVDYDEAYKKARNYVNKLVKNTKTRYHQESIDKTNSNTKQMWKHINQLIGRCSKTTNIQCIKVDNNILSNNKDIAASLNIYFTEIGPTLSNQIPQTNDNVDEFVEQVSVYLNSKTFQLTTLEML